MRATTPMRCIRRNICHTHQAAAFVAVAEAEDVTEATEDAAAEVAAKAAVARRAAAAITRRHARK